MPLSSKDEILINYAQSIKKEAADVIDYTNAIGSAVAAEIGTAAAIAAIQGGMAAASTGIAGGVATGALAGAGSAVGLGGTTATILGLAGPMAAFGGPIGIALALAGVGAAIYVISKQTDDNIDDLIDRLESLDPKDASVEKYITDVKEKLTYFKQFLGIPPPTANSLERAKKNKENIDGISQLLAFLKSIQQDWPMITQNISDWGFDPQQAKTALDKTTATIEQYMNKLISVAKDHTKKMISELEKEKGQNYRTIAEEIINIYNELFKIHGKVTFDRPAEQLGFDLAQKILKDEVEIEDLDKNINNMIYLLNVLRKAKSQPLKKVKKTNYLNKQISKRAIKENLAHDVFKKLLFLAKKNNAKDMEENKSFESFIVIFKFNNKNDAELFIIDVLSDLKLPTKDISITPEQVEDIFEVLIKIPIEIQKRIYDCFKSDLTKKALILGNSGKVDLQERVQRPVSTTKQSASSVVKQMQKIINHLSAIYNPDQPRLKDDGVYGKLTATALSNLLSKMPNLNQLITRKVGVTINVIRDPAQMQDPSVLNNLTKILSAFLSQETGQSSDQTERQVSTRQTGPGKCPWNKPDCTSEEINYCLMEMEVPTKYGPMRADKFLHMWGYKTPSEKAAIVRDAFSSVGIGFPAPIEWQQWGDILVKYVTNKLHNRMPGESQLRFDG